MEEDVNHIPSLIAKWLEGSLSEEGVQQLTRWRLTSDSNEKLFQQLTSKDTLMPKLKVLYEYDKESESKQLSHQIVPRTKIVWLSRTRIWGRYLAASCVLLLIAGGTWWLFNKKDSNKHIVQQQSSRFKNDVQPGGNNATLVLDDGTVIDLNSVQNGLLADENNAKILKKDGELTYKSSTSLKIKEEVTYNTLSTPKGGYYKLVLPDGSKVWLNAESSIRYPTAFTSDERRVEGSGELYFEVAPSMSMGAGKKKPFIVTLYSEGLLKRGENNRVNEIEVLGTHFNVNAYTNEDVIKATLLEGKIKIVNGQSSLVNGKPLLNKVTGSKILKPGQQSQIKGDRIEVVNNADLEGSVAWVNNTFVFNDLTIRPLMRQLSRWYSLEVVYDEEVNTHFIATIPRAVPLSKVLQVLEMTGGVHFEIDGRRIVVRK